MFQYRQALVRMRQGDSDRQIAAARIMGRRTAARLRELGTEHHWLDVAGPMPADEVALLAAQRERIQGGAAGPECIDQKCANFLQAFST